MSLGHPLASCAAKFLWGIAFAAAQQQALVPTEVEPERLSITFENQLLGASIRNCQLLRVLEELAARTQVAVVPTQGVGEERVSVELKNVSLEEGLARLLQEKEYDTFFYYRLAKQARASLRAVWIYPKGGGEGLRPVPPEAWASSKELEASLADSDPAVREKAYKALIERPDARSRDLVLKALLGTSETDDGLRERILDAARSNGMQVAPDLLAQLVYADRSEQIRWMALDALSQDAAARPVAEAALNDPSPSVRERAAAILAELEGTSRRSQHTTEETAGRP